MHVTKFANRPKKNKNPKNKTEPILRLGCRLWLGRVIGNIRKTIEDGNGNVGKIIKITTKDK